MTPPRTEDDLRAALRSPLDPSTLSRLTGVVHDLGNGGGGARTMPRTHQNRRHIAWLVAAAACVAVLAVAFGVALTRSSSAPSGHQGPAVALPRTPGPTAPPATSSAPRTVHRVYGEVVRTPVPYGSSTLALWMRQESNGALVLDGGHVRNGKPVTVFANGYIPFSEGYRCGSPTSFPRGFQCGYDAAGLTGDRHAWLLIGYVVGDVASVDLTVNGRPYRARTSTWSVDRRVHVYWLAGSTAKPKSPTPAAVSSMTARSGSGAVVATANGAIAHG